MKIPEFVEIGTAKYLPRLKVLWSDKDLFSKTKQSLRLVVSPHKRIKLLCITMDWYFLNSRKYFGRLIFLGMSLIAARIFIFSLQSMPPEMIIDETFAKDRRKILK